MFEKRRIAKEAVLATEAKAYAERTKKTVGQLAEDISAAEKLSDVGEKYLALQTVRKNISDIKLEEEQPSQKLQRLKNIDEMHQ